MLKTQHPKIFIGKIATYSDDEVQNIVNRFEAALTENSEEKIRALFNHFLPEASIKEKNLLAAAAQEPLPTKIQTMTANGGSYFVIVAKPCLK